jgi:hypothetical protein
MLNLQIMGTYFYLLDGPLQPKTFPSGVLQTNTLTHMVFCLIGCKEGANYHIRREIATGQKLEDYRQINKQ